MTPTPDFQYDAVQQIAVAAWADCTLTGSQPRRDQRDELHVDVRATLPTGALLNFKRLRLLDPWACEKFARECTDTPDGHLKMQQYLTTFADLLVTTLRATTVADPETPAMPAAPHAVLLAASQVHEEAMTYLWEPYIPLKMATILDGDPGTGKTGLACILAAAVSRQYPLPDQTGKPTLVPQGSGTVLMVAMEDHLGAVILPRLKRLKANLDHITFVNECQDDADSPRPFTLADLPLLTTYMETVRPQPVYIDAIQAVLGGKLDINQANAVTAILGPLKKLAEVYGCAVVCSRHPAKPGQQVAKVLYRGMGSQAFVGTVRSGLFVEEHSEDETKSFLVHYKSNTGSLGITHIFSKAQGRFEWAGVTRITHTILAGSGGPGPLPSERIKACLWLEARLKDGNSVPASQLYTEADETRDMSQKVLHTAADYLKVRKVQIPGDFLWTLPPPSPGEPLRVLQYRGRLGYRGYLGCLVCQGYQGYLG